MLPDEFIFDETVGSQKIGAYGTVLDKAHDSGVFLLPVRMSGTFGFVDLHHGSVESLQREEEQVI